MCEKAWCRKQEEKQATRQEFGLDNACDVQATREDV